MAGVNALHSDIGWSVPSHDLWKWLDSNPARHPETPLGWVIDNDGRIDGFIGSFRQQYYRGRTRLQAATSYWVIVSPRAKGSLKQLIVPFLEQKDVFAVSILNANELGSPIYRKLGLQAFPEQTATVKLSWIEGPTLTLLARMLRGAINRWPSLIPIIGERFTPQSANLLDPRHIKWPQKVHLITDLSDNSAYAQFWTNLRAQEHLVADRSPATLRWRTSQPSFAARPLLLGYHEAGGISAYAMAIISKTGPVDVPTLEIIDMVSLDKASPEAIPTLIRALKKATVKMGALKLRLHLVSPDLLEKLGPYARRAYDEGGWGHAFAHFNAPREQFADWQPTPYEGSYSYSLRQPQLRPVKPRRQKGQQPLAMSEG